jgi:hypothetical protein
MNCSHKALLSLAIGTLGLGASFGHAQAFEKENLSPNMPAVMPAEVENKGILTFASSTQETGEILDLEEVTLTYMFRNTGAGPLTITSVKTSCGCAVPELDKKTYMPNEAGELTVTFDPKGKNGPIARSITVFSDSEQTPSTTLTVRSLVKPVVVIEPRIIPFEAIQKGSSQTKEYKIYGRTDDFKVTRATSGATDVFDIEIEDMGETEYRGEMLRMSIVRVTVKDTASPNNHRTDVTIRTNDSRRSIMTGTVIARVLGDLGLNPVRLTMGRMVVGDEFEKEFHVRSKSGTPFNLENVAFNTVALESTTTFEPANEEKTDWIVKISGKVVAPAPRFNTPVRIITDVEDEKELTMQMYGQLRGQ